MCCVTLTFISSFFFWTNSALWCNAAATLLASHTHCRLNCHYHFHMPTMTTMNRTTILHRPSLLLLPYLIPHILQHLQQLLYHLHWLHPYYWWLRMVLINLFNMKHNAVGDAVSFDFESTFWCGLFDWISMLLKWNIIENTYTDGIVRFSTYI